MPKKGKGGKPTVKYRSTTRNIGGRKVKKTVTKKESGSYKRRSVSKNITKKDGSKKNIEKVRHKVKGRTKGGRLEPKKKEVLKRLARTGAAAQLLNLGHLAIKSAAAKKRGETYDGTPNAKASMVTGALMAPYAVKVAIGKEKDSRSIWADRALRKKKKGSYRKKVVNGVDKTESKARAKRARQSIRDKKKQIRQRRRF